MVLVCLPFDALWQHLPSYLGFSYLGLGASLHGCSSKAQLLLFILEEGYLLTAALMDRAEAWRWGATRRPWSGVATKSARLRACRSGGEELPHSRGQGRWPRGATPCPRSGAVAERNSPRSKEWQLRGRRRALRGASRFKGAMLSKCLIQFSVDGRGCVPSLLFDLRPNYGGGTEDNGDLLQKVLCRHCFTECPQACSRPLSTHALAGDSWTLTGKSGSVSD